MVPVTLRLVAPTVAVVVAPKVLPATAPASDSPKRHWLISVWAESGAARVRTAKRGRERERRNMP
jgi:hypothetical protein